MNKNRPKGIGDSLHNFFSKIGVNKVVKKVNNGNCGGCQKRQEKLNDLFPYKSRNNPYI